MQEKIVKTICLYITRIMSADCAFVLWDIFGIANAWLEYGNDAYEIYHGICLYACTLGVQYLVCRKHMP